MYGFCHGNSRSVVTLAKLGFTWEAISVAKGAVLDGGADFEDLAIFWRAGVSRFFLLGRASVQISNPMAWFRSNSLTILLTLYI